MGFTFLAMIMGFLAHSLHQVDQLKEKQASLLQERDNTERAMTHINFENNSLDASIDLQNLAILSWKKNDLIMAEKCFKDALAICEKLVDPNHPQARSLSMALREFYLQQPRGIPRVELDEGGMNTFTQPEMVLVSMTACLPVTEGL